jgi:superfamily II DNA or RNA helicase
MNRNIERKVVRKPVPPPKKVPTKKPPTQVPKFVPPTFPKTLNTYLGPKGYTIYKHELTSEQLTSLCKMLIAKPVTPGVAFGPTVNNDFPIYRESAKKMYVPRYFGEREFGLPKKISIGAGDEIAVPFQGELRENQVPVVKAYLDHVWKHPEIGGGGLLELPCAYGKTILSLNIISRLSRKTLVIVNKEFLLNQWVERIEQFLPSARVGTIQGPIIDIQDKDIVIGMLQSLSMKDYEPEVFSSFGLTIIDEVHHISSEVFSRALFKIVTKYMLGLSATMERKDGTTMVFKQFLGDVVYKGTRDEEHDVDVRAIEYTTTDATFNAVEYDFRGNPKYSTMIVKLCEYNRRSDFIVKVVHDMVLENPDNQIMILAHNRSLLTYLHDAIVHRGFATAGYYVGGMKEEALKETEGKQIVIATYAMAAEALDIKTLSSLVMATPKTDIVQSVGRILRTRHKQPIVVDIVDSHDLFVKQWAQRKKYYRSCNYRIRYIKSTEYKTMQLDWTTDKSWNILFEPKCGGSAATKCSIKSKVGRKPDANTQHGDSDADSDVDVDETPVSKCLIDFSYLGLDATDPPKNDCSK